MAKVSLTVLDQPTFVHTPGFPYPSGTADATDFATVSYPTSYPTITASEALTGGESDATTNDATFNGCVPVGPGPTSATSVDVPPFLSGGTFPVGVTTLYCTGNDHFDGQPGLIDAYQYQKVTVADQAVTLTVPGTQLAQATSSAGAAVSYGTPGPPNPVTAAEGSETEPVTSTCSADKLAATPFPADAFLSGGNFPIGGTTLTCNATDNVDGDLAGPPAPPPQSFTVIVTKTPCAALAGCNLHGLDLSGAYLAGADLSSGTDLSNANLNGAKLSCAGLICADLTNANLSGANLNQADLTGANLTGADLAGANLTGANLTGANLTGANLTGANLNKANLDGVTWSNTTCPDGTLSSASAPETCVGHL
jgi:hypothetical protein